MLTSNSEAGRLYHRQILEEKNNWLIKPCCFGKGEGIVFGKDVTQIEWQEIIKKCVSEKGFIIQEYIRQEKFPLMHQDSQKEEPRLKDYYLVGSLLCFNTDFLGNFK